jgi:hypothetical protein
MSVTGREARTARWPAAVGAGTTVLAGLGLALATRDGPGIGGYVSESGVSGAPHALLYRLSILALAVAAAGTALALRTVAGLAALALAVAVPCVVVAGTARCSAGCPLPPYQRPTPGDLVHAGGSIAATGLCALAMLAAALRCLDRPLRTVSRVSSAVTVPVLAATAVALLAIGRAPVTGALERVSLACCLAWLAAASALRAVPARR